nr:hypothetical protein [Salinisphaera sp. G21_0]
MLDRVPGLEFDRWGSLTVDEQMMTGCAGIFAGGDMVPSDRTATIAVGHGKKAARFMDSWLTGKKVNEITVKHLVDFDGLHLWYLPGPIISMSMRSAWRSVMTSVKWVMVSVRPRFVSRPVAVSPAVTALSVMAVSGPARKVPLPGWVMVRATRLTMNSVPAAWPATVSVHAMPSRCRPCHKTSYSPTWQLKWRYGNVSA